MIQLAGREHDFTKMDSLGRIAERPYGQLTGSPFYARAVRAAAAGDESAIDSLLTDSATTLVHGAYPGWAIATFAENLGAAERYARYFARYHRGLGDQYDIARLAGAVAFAGGRRGNALSALSAGERAAASMSRPWLRESLEEFRAICTALPILQTSTADAEAVLAAIERWDPDEPPPAGSPASANAFRRHRRLYLLGLVEARLGRHRSALARAVAIERAAVAEGTNAVPSMLARGVRGAVAMAQGDPAAALRALDTGPRTVPLLHQSMFRRAEGHARWLRAEALHALGRHDEALSRYAVATEVGITTAGDLELVLLAPSLLRRAELYERAGDRARARDHYARFRRLWERADPELQPLVRQAGERLSRLGGDVRPSAPVR